MATKKMSKDTLGKFTKKKTVARHKNHAGTGGRREADGHNAIGSHDGYSLPMKKKK